MLTLNSEQDIFNLITCPKIIKKPPQKIMRLENSCLRNDMELETLDTLESLNVFIRQNEHLPENFSIGLRWKPKNLGRAIILLRCNGPHGGNISMKNHFASHIHKLSIEDFNNGIFKERNVEQTSEYSTLDGAIDFFCAYCQIIDAYKVFPSMINKSLFT